MKKTLKISSWNVNGIRAVSKKGFFDWLEASGNDVVCLQETKAQPDQLGDEIKATASYPLSSFNSAERKGYSGVASYFLKQQDPLVIKHGFDMADFAKASPLVINEVNQGKKETTVDYSSSKLSQADFKDQVLAFNSEGRVIESHHKIGSEEFILFNIYFPNGGASTERLKFKLEFYEAFLLYIEKKLTNNPNIIVTGDYNTAHHAIDLARPESNANTSGFMPIERVYLDRFEKMGFRDSLRQFQPETPDIYTWWSFRTAARSRNIGWRIDYFYLSESMLDRLTAAQAHTDILGSDHCPISVEIKV